MKQNFSCTLTGKDWWKPFVICVLLSLALMIPNQLASMNPSEVPAKALATFFFSLALEGLLVVVQAAFSVILMRIAFPKISLSGKALSFTGKAGEYAKINILGFVLSLITLGFYIPAYARKVTAYLAEHTECEGAKAAFRSKTGKLMKYYILALVLPIIACCVIFGIVIARASLAASSSVSGSYGSAMIVFVLALFIALIPFIYLAYKWTINFAWKGITISWDTQFWASCGFILGQLCLLVITLGIAWPVVFVNVARYFAGRTVIRENGGEIGRLGFGGKAGKAFTLLWGQALLTVITFGIYMPWAYAACLKFFIDNAYFEEKQTLIAHG